MQWPNDTSLLGMFPTECALNKASSVQPMIIGFNKILSVCIIHKYCVVQTNKTLENISETEFSPKYYILEV